MMKIVAIVLSMSVLVASQELMGDGFGGLMVMNMLTGGQAFDFNNLFGGGRMMAPQNAARTGARGARGQAAAAAAANPFGGLTGLFVMDVI